MNRSILLLAVALGCGDSTFPPEDCAPPLPPTDDDGDPWPTYTAANAALATCTADGYTRRRGSCSDGKAFIEGAGPFTGYTQYFDGEALVGLRRYSDVVSYCDEYRFGDVACDESSAEDIDCR